MVLLGPVWTLQRYQTTDRPDGPLERGGAAQRTAVAASRMMAAKAAASRLAPPTSSPSTSRWPISSAVFSGRTEPAVLDADGLGGALPRQLPDNAPDVVAGRLGVVPRGRRPVPMAQMGS